MVTGVHVTHDMAAPPSNAGTRQRDRDARHIRELFHGRFTEEESRRLLRIFDWDRERTASNILNAEPGEILDLLADNPFEDFADADTDNIVSRAWQRIKDSRNVRELFYGRFSGEESRILLRYHDWDMSRAVNYVLDAEPGAVSDLLDNNRVERMIAVVTENNVLRDLARRNEIGRSVRQFGCGECDNMWWRRVPDRKPVSRCKRCKRKFDAVPLDQMWGWAEFECQCGSRFKGMGQMGMTLSMCYHCGVMCLPARVLPPLKRDDQRRSNRNNHSCAGWNCFNRRGRGDPNQICIHPLSTDALLELEIDPHGQASRGSRDSARQGRGNQTNMPTRAGSPSVGAAGASQGRGASRGVSRGRGRGRGGTVSGHGNQDRIEPRSAARMVLVASEPHVSSGSTVNTFLDQSDLEPPYEPSLASIQEVADVQLED